MAPISHLGLIKHMTSYNFFFGLSKISYFHSSRQAPCDCEDTHPQMVALFCVLLFWVLGGGPVLGLSAPGVQLYGHREAVGPPLAPVQTAAVGCYSVADTLP